MDPLCEVDESWCHWFGTLDEDTVQVAYMPKLHCVFEPCECMH